MGRHSGSGSKFNVFGSRTLVINYNIRSLGTQSYLFSEVEANGGLCGQGKPASTEPKGEAGLAYKTKQKYRRQESGLHQKMRISLNILWIRKFKDEDLILCKLVSGFFLFYISNNLPTATRQCCVA